MDYFGVLQQGCGCDDCEAAVSPGAYLASLLDYTLKHVRNDGAKIDLAFLEARFHQPFAQLPVDCNAIVSDVHQVRLAVEVLLDYVGPRPLFGTEREKKLADAEADYRLEAYTRLLTQLGTTYAEVRRARAAVVADRTTQAERLGIDLTPDMNVPREDELDRLFLDASLPTTDARSLTELTLERIFGLADTGRDHLSKGVKYGDIQEQITRWNLEGAYWGTNTDADGLVYLSLFKLAPDAFAVTVYTDVARTRVVANGERKTALGAIRLVPENGSGLRGVVEIDYKADATNISLSLVPSMLGWRLRHLRTEWAIEDWPTDAPAPNTIPLPLIDPQVISLSDLRSARPGEPPFDLWLTRFNWLGNQRSALKVAREAAANQLAGLETIIAQALSTPDRAVTIADLDALDTAQRLGERIEQRLRSLGLTPGAFAFLLPVFGLARANLPIVDLEWDIVYDTLLYARKQHEFAAWRTAEQTQKLTLSPSMFRVGDDASIPDQARSLDVPLWLSTRETRRGWVDVLNARIGQETAIVAGLDSAVDSVEETTLPLLRDALLVASDAEGSGVQERADWLTQRLLIDFRMSGAQLTTRVAHALETLQELLFRLRTGQLEQDTIPALAPLVSICAIAQGERRIDLFGRGQDNVLWQRVWDGRWHRWRSLGILPGSGIDPSDPIVVAHRNGQLSLIVRGGDRFLWHRQYKQEWLNWQRVEDNLELVANPAAAGVRSADQMDVFALRIGDLQVMQRHYDGLTWSAWNAIGATSSRSPAATSWAADRLDLFLALAAPDLFKPLHRWWDGATWQDEPLDNVLGSDPAATSWDVNRLDLFQNRSGHLWQKSWNGAWQPWADLDPALVGDDPHLQAVPSVYSHLPGTLDVFALRSSGGGVANIWRRRFAANAWSAWTVLPSENLELMADDFDAEWAWIGSYSTWRSATFVSLYPDNLLQPSLIAHQTPAFSALVSQTRPTRQLTPQQACAAAQTYSEYLQDVSSLDITATCQVETVVNKGDPCKTAAPVPIKLLYMFGRTSKGKVYWSAIDPSDRSGYAQSFWAEVPLAPKDGNALAPKVVTIIGALPWLKPSINQHYIYLFLDTDEPQGRKLRLIRFDLNNYGPGAWEADIADLTALPTYIYPGTSTTTSTVVDNLTILPVQSESVDHPPQLAIHDYLHTKNVYVRPLNANGDGWKPGINDWDSFQFKPYYNYPPGMPEDLVYGMEAALSINGVTWLVYFHNQSLRAYANVKGQSGVEVCYPPSGFHGALPGDWLTSSIFLFYEDAGQLIYREIKPKAEPGTNWPGLGTAFIPSPNLTTLARHSGSFTPTFFVIPNKGGHSYAYKCTAANGELTGSSKFDVVPVLLSEAYVSVGESMTALQGRRSGIKQVYQQNKGASASILAYLAEAYRLVPQQIALNQQSSGEYVSALDWFATVYDYRAQQGERYIDYGLEIDAGLPDTGVYHHAEDWILDPLNPHAIALTRRYAYVRFTIASIIRCFNAFADAEFTYDTDESLVRARLLYATALELSNVPELQQAFATCDALIGEFVIQPGALVPPEVAAALGNIADELTQGQVGSAPNGIITLQDMLLEAQSGTSWNTILLKLSKMKQAALNTVPVPSMVGTAVTERVLTMAKVYSGLLTDPGMEKMSKDAGEIAVNQASIWINAGK